MYHQTRGIVLHTIKYSETSVIARIYTDKFGLLSFIVKGVRSAKSKNKASLMQPLTMLDMQVNYRESRGLQFIKEFTRDYNYTSIPFDTVKSTIALFLLEVIIKSVREHEPNEELFEFIYAAIQELDKNEKVNPDFHLLFLTHLSTYLGFMPHENFSETNCHFEMREGLFVAYHTGPFVLNKQESELVHLLTQNSVFNLSAVTKNRAERSAMLKCLLKFYQLHLENFSLKSPEVLEAVLG